MSSDGFDEAACLRRGRERDEGACRELVEHMYPAVIRIVRAHLPRRDAEEERGAGNFHEDVCASRSIPGKGSARALGRAHRSHDVLRLTARAAAPAGVEPRRSHRRRIGADRQIAVIVLSLAAIFLAGSITGGLFTIAIAKHEVRRQSDPTQWFQLTMQRWKKRLT